MRAAAVLVGAAAHAGHGRHELRSKTVYDAGYYYVGVL